MRPFSPEEKTEYQRLLMGAGRERFAAHGIKKTTVEELAAAANIAKGSFYLFFHSKEELYFRLLTDEVKRLRESALAKIRDAEGASNAVKLKAFFRDIAASFQDNAMVRLALTPEAQAIFRREEIRGELTKDGDIKTGLISLFAALIETGVVQPMAPELLANITRALLMVLMRQDALDESCRTDTIHFLLDCVAEGVAAKSS